ncbi:MAG: restriction endonuclease, SacI family [Planctomycetales bacterium]
MRKRESTRQPAESAPTPEHQAALRTLHDAVKSCGTFSPKKLGVRERDAIRSIIQGDHLTFRYILMTALLAKVVEPRSHMRSLQAGAKLTGAYDARSLCHNVWVPFEREHLDSRLGGSNEPFLNKPARFPAVEKTNAVRAGKDRDLLHVLYDLLESLNSAKPAHLREAFLLAMSVVMERAGRTRRELPLSAVTLTADALGDFLDTYLQSSFGGETPVSVVGAILRSSQG